MPQIKAGSINLNYDTFGDGEPLLLIMGFGMPGMAWLPILPLLSGFKCIYFDNRGTGLSDKPEDAYTVELMADDASNLLNALNIPKAKVFGVSMGGMIAQELTLRHPEQVERLVLACTTPGGLEAKMASPEAVMMLVEGTKLMASDPEQALDFVLPLLYPEEFTKEHPEIKQMMLEGSKMMPPTPPDSIDRTVLGVITFNAYDRLDQIKCPVLIVHGDKDLLVPPENAHLLKSRIPQAELLMIPDAGHAFQAADPIGIHQRIAQFLRNSSAPKTAETSRVGIDHLMINANRYEESVKFYSWLMPKLGYPDKHVYDGEDPMTGFSGTGGGLWLSNSAHNLRSDNFHKRRVGLREIAFRADSRARVDALANEIEANGGKILDAPQEYPQYAPGYYSVFFTDPDGLKLEVVTYSR